MAIQDRHYTDIEVKIQVALENKVLKEQAVEGFPLLGP